MGSSNRPHRKPDRAGAVLRRSRPTGAAARVREEIADHAKGRSKPRPTASTGSGELTSSAHPHIGSSFESLLKEFNIYEAVTTEAVKTVLAWQLRHAMESQGVSKSEMAARIRTSRAQLDRLLDPSNDHVQLDTLRRAAAAVGRKIRLELVE